MKTMAIVCILCLVAASSAAAGYTDSLWNESEERVYYDCGDWSGVHNSKSTDLSTPYYYYDDDGGNWGYMFTPTNWGYPEDAKLELVRFGDVAWACMYIRGFDKTLNVAGSVYTDDPSKINYKTSYLSYRGWSTLYWSIYDVEHDIMKSDTGRQVTIRNQIIFYGKHSTGKTTEREEVISTPSDSIDYMQWNSVTSSIDVTLSNHSEYMILTVPTPENVTGIKVSINSENATATYEKHAYCIELNTSENFRTCDLVEYEYHVFTGISPFGADTYILPYEPDYSVNVTMYTPFEMIDATVNVTETDAEPTNTELQFGDGIWDVLYLLVPFYLIYWLVGRI